MFDFTASHGHDPMPRLTDRSAAGAVAAARAHIARCQEIASVAAGMAQAVGAAAPLAQTIEGRHIPEEVCVALEGPDGAAPCLSVRQDGRVLALGGAGGHASWAELSEEQIAALPQTQGVRWSQPPASVYGAPAWVGVE